MELTPYNTGTYVNPILSTSYRKEMSGAVARMARVI